MTPWKQATIIGTGLIGGSLGLALRETGLAGAVVGVGHRQATLDEARARGAADRTTHDPAEGVAGSDLVVLATPVSLFEEIARRIAESLEPEAVVIVVGSPKAAVVRALEALVPKRCVFIGCHPIAGSERRGMAHARADLFAGATCVVTPTEATPAEPLERVCATWAGLGMTVRQLSPTAHDRFLAQISHLPHVIAAALVRAPSGEVEPFIGPGWADTTRVASGDAALWRDILMSNAAEVAAALDGLHGILAAFGTALRQGDADRVYTLLVEAKQRRDRLLEQKEGR